MQDSTTWVKNIRKNTGGTGLNYEICRRQAQTLFFCLADIGQTKLSENICECLRQIKKGR